LIDEVRRVPRDLDELSDHLNEPSLALLTRRFLFERLYPNEDSSLTTDYPLIHSKISVFHSASATFYAPSDDSGIRGMRRERIRSTPSWRNKGPRHDCAFVVEDENLPGMRGLRVVRVKVFFSFTHEGTTYPCALVEWFKTAGRGPDADTGMWKVKPESVGNRRDASVLHLDTFFRSAHLLPVFGSHPVPLNFDWHYTLDCFDSYFVNKYIDHLAHEIAY
jgi:hypothetical protein